MQRACSVVLANREHRTLDMILVPYSTDRLRFDVALVDRSEIFSWAGASQFNEDGIDHLVREGPMGTGAFGGFLIVIFTTDVKKFVFTRELNVDGRDRMEYSFEVPAAGSHYRVKVKDRWEHIGYKGTVEVDPDTAEVLRLTVETRELPMAFGICTTRSDLDHAMLPIGSSQFLLPTRVRQHWVDPFAKETVNTTTFASCREYKGESTLIFPEDPASISSLDTKDPAPTAPRVPEGLRFKFELMSSIPTDIAAAGDLFTAKLTEPIRDAKSKVLVAKGAIVEGRLLRVESFRNPPHVMVVMRPRWLTITGIKYRLAGLRDWEREIQENRKRKKSVEIQLLAPGEERSEVFRFEGSHVVLPKGFRSEWRTVTAPQVPAPTR